MLLTAMLRIAPRRVLAGAMLTALGMAPLGAQTGNQSDVSGMALAGASASASVFSFARGAPTPVVIGGVNGLSRVSVMVPPMAVPLLTAMTTGAFRCAVHPSVLIDSETGTEFAQLATITHDPARAEALVAHLEGVIASMAGSPPRGTIRSFLQSVTGLLAQPTPKGVARATAAFNTMIDQSSAGFLVMPPPAFLAGHSLLHRMIVETAR